VAERHRDPSAFAAWGSFIAADHLGAGGGLVEEHEGVRVEIELKLEPGQVHGLDLFPLLLSDMADNFFRMMLLT
jgi:hypothetical protein